MLAYVWYVVWLVHTGRKSKTPASKALSLRRANRCRCGAQNSIVMAPRASVFAAHPVELAVQVAQS